MQVKYLLPKILDFPHTSSYYYICEAFVEALSRYLPILKSERAEIIHNVEDELQNVDFTNRHKKVRSLPTPTESVHFA